MAAARGDTREVVIDVVLGLLAEGGYDAVKVRDVAKRARVSTKTIYAVFTTREHLIVAALEQWVVAHVYVNVAHATEGESLYDVMMRFLRAQFQPWEQHPRMLEAYHRAKLGPAGGRLNVLGTTVARRVGEALLIDDPEFARDLEEIMRNVSEGLTNRFVDGDIEVHEILPRLEVAARYLTAPARVAAR